MRGLWLVAVVLTADLAGCGGASGNEAAVLRPEADDHFTCAALIGAADRLVARGALPASAFARDEALLSAMGHLNAWAVPRRLPEADAFAQVNRERDRLVGSVPAAEIGRRAGACVASARGS